MYSLSKLTPELPEIGEPEDTCRISKKSSINVHIEEKKICLLSLFPMF